MSRYVLVDLSDDDGEDFMVEDEFGEVGHFFSRSEASRFLRELNEVEVLTRRAWDSPGGSRTP